MPMFTKWHPLPHPREERARGEVIVNNDTEHFKIMLNNNIWGERKRDKGKLGREKLKPREKAISGGLV